MTQISKLKTTALVGAAAFGASFVGADSANADQVYTVNSGDTLSQIASDVTGNKDNYQKIADDNGIQDANLILVGQQINIKDEYINPGQTQNEAVQTENNYTTQQESYTAPTTTSSAVQDYSSSNQDYSQQTYQSGWSGVDYSQSNNYNQTTSQTTSSGSGSVYDQFIAAGGTQELWDNIVMPESGGNPNAVSPNGYRGLGQTKESWGTGDVATQTKGMLGYISARYGSPEAALAFRAARGWY